MNKDMEDALDFFEKTPYAWEPQNLLVEYKGGGYDGCFWEWNYFMIDDQGDFVNLISTGYKGLENDQGDIALGMIENPENSLRDGVTICNLDDEEDVKDFISSGNATRMKQLSSLHWLLTEKMIATCDKCGKDHEVVNMIASDYSGDGGIAISAKNLYCEDCYFTDEYFPIATLIYGSYKLNIGEYKSMSGDRCYYEYALVVSDESNSEILFSGDDFSPSPMDDIDSLECLISLLSFLTLSTDDTDDEYFKNYNERQLEFAKDIWGDRQELSLLAYDFENNDIDEYYNVDESYGEYGQNVFTITNK